MKIPFIPLNSAQSTTNFQTNQVGEAKTNFKQIAIAVAIVAVGVLLGAAAAAIVVLSGGGFAALLTASAAIIIGSGSAGGGLLALCSSALLKSVYSAINKCRKSQVVTENNHASDNQDSLLADPAHLTFTAPNPNQPNPSDKSSEIAQQQTVPQQQDKMPLVGNKGTVPIVPEPKKTVVKELPTTFVVTMNTKLISKSNLAPAQVIYLFDKILTISCPNSTLKFENIIDFLINNCRIDNEHNKVIENIKSTMDINKSSTEQDISEDILSEIQQGHITQVDIKIGNGLDFTFLVLDEGKIQIKFKNDFTININGNFHFNAYGIYNENYTFDQILFEQEKWYYCFHLRDEVILTARKEDLVDTNSTKLIKVIEKLPTITSSLGPTSKEEHKSFQPLPIKQIELQRIIQLDSHNQWKVDQKSMQLDEFVFCFNQALSNHPVRANFYDVLEFLNQQCILYSNEKLIVKHLLTLAKDEVAIKNKKFDNENFQQLDGTIYIYGKLNFNFKLSNKEYVIINFYQGINFMFSTYHATLFNTDKVKVGECIRLLSIKISAINQLECCFEAGVLETQQIKIPILLDS